MIDAGTDLSSLGVIDDFSGVTRPQGIAYDIGAHEYVIDDTTAPICGVNPSTGLHQGPQSLTLTAIDNYDPNPVILYTLDGSDPRVSLSAMLYDGTPVSVNDDLPFWMVGSDYFGNECEISGSYIINFAPTATAPDIVRPKANQPGTSQITVVDPDPTDTHTFAVTAQGAQGVATVDQSGLVTYTPYANDKIPDRFIVLVSDQNGGSAEATILVTH